MAETLGQKQRRFARMVPRLLDQAHKLGYEVTFGDAYRDARAFGELGTKKRGVYGRASSLHKQRLALDLNLFKPGPSGRLVYLTSTAAHQPLGEFWESIGGTWGGRFDDGNHYSLAHGGRR